MALPARGGKRGQGNGVRRGTGSGTFSVIRALIVAHIRPSVCRKVTLWCPLGSVDTWYTVHSPRGKRKKGNNAGHRGISLANEVAFEYGPWGVVTKSMQDHAAAATDTDPNVQYAYEDGIDGTEAKYVRPDYVTYPGPST